MRIAMTHDALAEAEIKALVERFFRCVSFEEGGAPAFNGIDDLFIDAGLLIKNSGATPEICNVQQFIAPRQASVDAGDLTRFREAELSAETVIFGNVAHRFGGYVKSGTLKGALFEVKGLISTQFVRTLRGWRMSSMAWDDERPGLELPKQYG
jgi:hypothetical protein